VKLNWLIRWLNGFISVELQESFSCQAFEPDGAISFQVRPGRWRIEILARITKNPDMIPYPK